MGTQYRPCHPSMVSTGVFGQDKMTMCCLKMGSSRMSSLPEKTDRKLGPLGKAASYLKAVPETNLFHYLKFGLLSFCFSFNSVKCSLQPPSKQSVSLMKPVISFKGGGRTGNECRDLLGKPSTLPTHVVFSPLCPALAGSQFSSPVLCD